MKVNTLKLAYMRAIETAEFHFQPDFNLIVGVNGVGKSSVLDALRICMSRVLPSVTESRAKAMSFEVRDIRDEHSFVDAELYVTVGAHEFNFTRHQWRESHAADDQGNVEKLRREILEAERLGERKRKLLRQLDESQVASDTDIFIPSKASLQAACRAATSMPSCVFFSTSRSVVSHAKARSRSAGGTSAAYVDALVSRPMYVAQHAEWMRAQNALATEDELAARHLCVLQDAISTFLPGYENLSLAAIEPVVFGERTKVTLPRLQVDHGPSTLELDQLSDGEKGVLALVLDLARRLSQANPLLDDPLREGEAIVLIDEIDLHLHPQWQRQIVQKLRETFPRCQFIATTHSPQVIGEVEHDRIHVIAEGEVSSPHRSYGVDASGVLEEIMGTDKRTTPVQRLISNVSQAVGIDDYEGARALLSELVEQVGEGDAEVIRIRTLLNLLDEDE